MHQQLRLTAIAGLAALLFSGALATNASAAETCTREQRAEADKELWLNERDTDLAVSLTFPWGPPRPTVATENERLLVQRDYVIRYDADLFGPLWSADRFERKLRGGRINCFRPDPRLRAPAPRLSDYDDPIFDQGHMVPNGDMTFSDIAVVNTFMMSNMSPQFCQFNRGVWQILESYTREWAPQYKTLYVINGAVFDRDGDGKRDLDGDAVRMKSRNGKARVAVPSAYYKIFAYQREDGALETLSILLKHDQIDVDFEGAWPYLKASISDIETISAQAGLQFFPDWQGAVVERRDLWPIKRLRSHGSLVDARCRQLAGAFIVEGTPRVYALP